ncbi:MAG: ammonia-forming cytochrome c nitrite reductase subunit c552, partial [Thermodesulfovibrionales bacterium]|nr:ammonia-forming cytochrome c nitrite reductase subunit c552 [Thermodesulfovibrionales bacterium]
MQKKNYLRTVFCLLLLSVLAVGCEQKAKIVAAPVTIPEGEKDPAVWGRVYPLHYDSYLKNSERTKDYSKYRNDGEYRLTPWPFQFVLFDGWGMGVEYNEPNGH